MTTPSFTWDADVNLPVSGRTPAAAHASATGAQAAAVVHGKKLRALRQAFADAPGHRLTLAGCAAMMGCADHTLCSTWDRAKRVLRWIEGTGEFVSYRTSYGKTVKREVHQWIA